jgi:hypothetical protein
MRATSDLSERFSSGRVPRSVGAGAVDLTEEPNLRFHSQSMVTLTSSSLARWRPGRPASMSATAWRLNSSSNYLRVSGVPWVCWGCFTLDCIVQPPSRRSIQPGQAHRRMDHRPNRAPRRLRRFCHGRRHAPRRDDPGPDRTDPTKWAIAHTETLPPPNVPI